VTLTCPFVDVKLISHDVSQVTPRDIDLVRRISEIAREQGMGAEPSALTEFELALDTADLAAVGPFWAALLIGSSDSLKGEDVVDHCGRVPSLWFQRTDAHAIARQRFHIDLWVPDDVAQERIAAAVAAVDEWSTTRRPRRSSSWPTLRATRPACARASTVETVRRRNPWEPTCAQRGR
jgi:4a-hydroxytetrahydrobiopterin dehydratase